jgi:hypothetical protein
MIEAIKSMIKFIKENKLEPQSETKTAPTKNAQ